MKTENIYVSELSTSTHRFNKYHFCRGNSNKRKSRLGVIVKGSGTYIYLGRRLKVREGDVVFIPENIYCYSEWHGEPEIEVIYVSCFIHLDGIGYEPEIVCGDDSLADDIIDVSAHLSGERINIFEAYSRFYKVLERVFARLSPSVASFDKTLQTAIEYITDSWDKIESVGDIAEHCRVSESKLYHLFGGELGQTPIGFLNSIKINIAIELLENSDHSISCISRLAGFNSENHFRKIFSALTGTTPKKYRSGCRG